MDKADMKPRRVDRSGQVWEYYGLLDGGSYGQRYCFVIISSQESTSDGITRHTAVKTQKEKVSVTTVSEYDEYDLESLTYYKRLV